VTKTGQCDGRVSLPRSASPTADLVNGGSAPINISGKVAKKAPSSSTSAPATRARLARVACGDKRRRVLERATRTPVRAFGKPSVAAEHLSSLSQHKLMPGTSPGIRRLRALRHGPHAVAQARSGPSRAGPRPDLCGGADLRRAGFACAAGLFARRRLSTSQSCGKICSPPGPGSCVPPVPGGQRRPRLPHWRNSRRGTEPSSPCPGDGFACCDGRLAARSFSYLRRSAIPAAGSEAVGAGLNTRGQSGGPRPRRRDGPGGSLRRRAALSGDAAGWGRANPRLRSPGHPYSLKL